MNPFTESDLLAARNAYDLVLNDIGYAGMAILPGPAKNALRAALDAADRSRQDREEKAARDLQEHNP